MHGNFEREMHDHANASVRIMLSGAHPAVSCSLCLALCISASLCLLRSGLRVPFVACEEHCTPTCLLDASTVNLCC